MSTFSRLLLVGMLGLFSTQALANPITTEVSEPATMSLLFIGLFGLALARRKVKSSD